MKYNSQNNEIKIVLDYFKGKKGTVLDIGSNDGKTYSNSYDLIKLGWFGVCVEPSSVYKELLKLYSNNHRVACHKVAIGAERGIMTLMESGAHVKDGKDKALVSSLDILETQKWRNNGVEFTDVEVDVITFNDLLELHPNKKFDFITIDVEGFEMQILPQIDLTAVGCKVLCIEWNGNRDLQYKFSEYCNRFGLKEIHRNAENLIFALL